MTKLVYKPCSCVRRGHCFIPGSRGVLYAITKGIMRFIAPCPRCKEGRSA